MLLRDFWQCKSNSEALALLSCGLRGQVFSVRLQREFILRVAFSHRLHILRGHAGVRFFRRGHFRGKHTGCKISSWPQVPCRPFLHSLPNVGDDEQVDNDHHTEGENELNERPEEEKREV